MLAMIALLALIPMFNFFLLSNIEQPIFYRSENPDTGLIIEGEIMSEETGAPSYLKMVAIIAIVWNALGAMAYLMQMSASAQDLFPDSTELQDIFNMTPVWVKSAFAFAVWGGLAGSIGFPGYNLLCG